MSKERWIVQIDLYKMSGKHYTGGRITIQADPWDSNEEILQSFWGNQELVTDTNKTQWTIVASNIPESENDPNYRTSWKKVLQVADMEFSKEQ